MSSAFSILRQIPFAWLFLLTTILVPSVLICNYFSGFHTSFQGLKVFYQSWHEHTLLWVSFWHSYFWFTPDTDACLNREKSTTDLSYDLQDLFQPQHPVPDPSSGLQSMILPLTSDNLTSFSSTRVVQSPRCALLGAGGNLWGLLPTVLHPGHMLLQPLLRVSFFGHL